jgi:hypothetical protein
MPFPRPILGACRRNSATHYSLWCRSGSHHDPLYVGVDFRSYSDTLLGGEAPCAASAPAPSPCNHTRNPSSWKSHTQIIFLGRRALPRQESRLAQRTVDFTRLDSEPLLLVHDAFCCLGTTIIRAGSREAFRAVDYEAVLAFARAAQRAGARRFLVVTALGANARSPVFYNRAKGEVEEVLKGLGLESLVVAQPLLLLGEWQEKCPGERAAIVASRLLAPLPSRPLRRAWWHAPW